MTKIYCDYSGFTWIWCYNDNIWKIDLEKSGGPPSIHEKPPEDPPIDLIIDNAISQELKKYIELYCAFWCATPEEFWEHLKEEGVEITHSGTVKAIKLQNKEFHRLHYKNEINNNK